MLTWISSLLSSLPLSRPVSPPSPSMSSPLLFSLSSRSGFAVRSALSFPVSLLCAEASLAGFSPSPGLLGRGGGGRKTT